MPISEIQARWSVAILAKKISLPSPGEMSKSIEEFQANLNKKVSALPTWVYVLQEDERRCSSNALRYC